MDGIPLTYIRRLAENDIEQYPETYIPSGAEGIRSDAKPQPYNKFYNLTYMTHESFKSGKATSCNLYTQHFARRVLGLADVYSLHLDSHVQKFGRQLAYLKPATGASPKYGDIVCMRTPAKTEFGAAGAHTFLSRQYTDARWLTADAGQNNGKEYDRIKLLESHKIDGTIVGWLDLDLLWELFCPKPHPQPVKSWAIGLWAVNFQGWNYFYYFDPSHEVYYTQTALESLSEPMGPSFMPQGFNPLGQGRWAHVNGETVLTRWYKTGTMERFTRKASTGGVLEMEDPVLKVSAIQATPKLVSDLWGLLTAPR